MRGTPIFLNVLTGIVLLATCAVGTFLAAVALNPDSIPAALRPQELPTVLPTPFPSPTSVIDTFPTVIPTGTPAPTEATASPTSTLTAMPEVSATVGASQTAVRTGTATQTPTLTVTATATQTRTPTTSATSAGPSLTPTNTLSPLPFTLQPGSPAYQPNYANTAGCNWMGVAGQAFDLSGRPIIGLIVRVTFEDGSIDAITGTNKSYGEGGYEVYLNDNAEATDDAYTIQLLNASSSPLSGQFGFDTFADCNRNLIVVNFVQNH